MTISICHPKNGTDDCSGFVIFATVWHSEKGGVGREAICFSMYIKKIVYTIVCMYQNQKVVSMMP